MFIVVLYIKKNTHSSGAETWGGNSNTQRCLNIPSQSWTPTIPFRCIKNVTLYKFVYFNDLPKIKNTKKHSKRTFPSIGSVSSRSITSILIPKIFKSSNSHFLILLFKNLLGILLIARRGLSTRMVLIAVKLRFSICRQYSNAPDITIKKSNLFQESAI